MMVPVGKDDGQTSKSPEGEADGVNLINGATICQPPQAQLSGGGDEKAKAVKGDTEDLEGVVISLPSPSPRTLLAKKSAAQTVKAADMPSIPELNGDEAAATKSLGVWI